MSKNIQGRLVFARLRSALEEAIQFARGKIELLVRGDLDFTADGRPPRDKNAGRIKYSGTEAGMRIPARRHPLV
jgi:hypothetical protein